MENYIKFLIFTGAPIHLQSIFFQLHLFFLQHERKFIFRFIRKVFNLTNISLHLVLCFLHHLATMRRAEKR